MSRQYFKWHSLNLDREMELLVFGDAGERVIVFPTSCGRFYDWENREMIKTLEPLIEQDKMQIFCVDSVDAESWWNTEASPQQKAARHLAYHDYIIEEVLPFTKEQNANTHVTALGASMGAYHATNLTLRYPDSFNRCVAMSGPYDFVQMSAPYNVFAWANDCDDKNVLQCNPVPLVNELADAQIEKLKKVEMIFPIGQTDPLYEGNVMLSRALNDRNVAHAFYTWDGFAHDWPYWKEMLLLYVEGERSKSMEMK